MSTTSWLAFDILSWTRTPALSTRSDGLSSESSNSVIYSSINLRKNRRRPSHHGHVVYSEAVLRIQDKMKHSPPNGWHSCSSPSILPSARSPDISLQSSKRTFMDRALKRLKKKDKNTSSDLMVIYNTLGKEKYKEERGSLCESTQMNQYPTEQLQGTFSL